MSRPRREWLAPVKGKPSVLLWEQAGEGLHGMRQVGTAVMCLLRDRSCRLSTACLGSILTSVKYVTALWVVWSLLLPFEPERSIAVMYVLFGWEKETNQAFHSHGAENTFVAPVYSNLYTSLHPRILQIFRHQAHCFIRML